MSNDFDISSKNLKHYPHFDAPIPLHEIKQIVTDETLVASNKFYPFLHYQEEWQPYRSEDIAKPDKKSRPIRYGARRDAYIFLYYRRMLSKLYEEQLASLGISDCPIAYRKIQKDHGGGKCNIDFAKDAFEEVNRLGNCVAVALDIKSYFDSIDHAKIKQIWCDLLGVTKLPADHYAVFKNITRYRYVDQKSVYLRLGYLKTVKRGVNLVAEFTMPYTDIPKKLCSSADFRLKICGGDPALPSLIKKNENPFGIPQGAPISDLIANFYLIEFDRVMHSYAVKHGGCYMRYSDDILIIVPGGESDAKEAIKLATEKITTQGPQLCINEAKTCVVQFNRHGKGGAMNFRHLKGPHGKNGLEYLGFRFDGRNVYIRESTMSRFYRKVSMAAKRESARHVDKNPGLTVEELIKTFDYSLFSQRFIRVKRENLTDDYRSWTFYSYLKRAVRTFGTKDDCILRQTRNFKSIMRSRIQKSIEKHVSRQSKVSSVV